MLHGFQMVFPSLIKYRKLFKENSLYQRFRFSIEGDIFQDCEGMGCCLICLKSEF